MTAAMTVVTAEWGMYASFTLFRVDLSVFLLIQWAGTVAEVWISKKCKIHHEKTPFCIGKADALHAAG